MAFQANQLGSQVDLHVNKKKKDTHMVKKLFVGNLSYDITQSELEAAFSEAGEIETVDIVFNKLDGRPRGFAFVTMADEAGAEKAVALLNGKELRGRAIVVNESRPREDRPAYGGGNRSGGYGQGGYNRGGGNYRRG